MKPSDEPYFESTFVRGESKHLILTVTGAHYSALAKLRREIASESPYLAEDVSEVAEGNTGLDCSSETSFLAIDERLGPVGYLIVKRGRSRRIQHRAEFTMGVLSRSQRKGIGRSLVAHLIEWARIHSIRRLELSVVEENVAAVQLYRRMGFEIEGRKMEAFAGGGRFCDGLFMARLID